MAASPGEYYDWRRRPASDRARRREVLVASNKAIHGEVKARNGSPRIHAELVARGKPSYLNIVAKLVREHGIAAKTERRFRCTTDSNHGRPVAENVVNGRFEPGAANRVWTADITSLGTRKRWLYFAVVENRDSRRIVGSSMADCWSTPWRWRSRGACRARGCWLTRTGAASTPASTTSDSWPGTGSCAA
jgi:transposase InsO family protein